MSIRPDLPPPDRFGAWLDRRSERSSRSTDVHKFWCTSIGIMIGLAGMLLTGAGAIPEWLGIAIAVVGVLTAAVLMARYHPDNRRF